MKKLLPLKQFVDSMRFSILNRYTMVYQLRTLDIALLLCILVALPAYSQNIIDDGGVHDASALGTYYDLTIPNNPAIAEITFILTGGDGGYARVIGVNGVLTANGGQGAKVTATFPIGSGAGEIPLGSSFRFVEGEKGVAGDNLPAGFAYDYGGGGGGSAVLYSLTGSSPWILLAVAGGGGGAYQGSTSGSTSHGEGGLVLEGNGQGGAGNIDFGGGGGGRYQGGVGVSCFDVSLNMLTTAGEGGSGGMTFGYGGDSDGCHLLTWRDGGAGYGGGGAGAGVGGGGGGYSGGAAGAAFQNGGGGGGSYLGSGALAGSSIYAGQTVSSPDDGSITYQVTLNQLPVAMCKNATLSLDASGNATLTTGDINNGSSDPEDESNVILSLSKTSFDCSDLGANTVTLTVTDTDGGSSNCTATVTVNDNIAPNAVCQNITVQLDANGMVSITGADVDGGSTDNCTIVSMWLEGQTEYDCGNTGVHEVVLKARDQSGNVGSNIAYVTVKFYEPDFESMLGIADGDTLYQVNCQVPREVALSAQDRAILEKYGTLKTSLTKVDLSENPPWSQFSVWENEIVLEDACAHRYRFTFYQALYDLNPPTYQYFPYDTVVATSSDLPPVDSMVRIIDVCQYVEWDTVMTMPVLDLENGDTLGYTRRWMARDPSGHQSFRDQMIWLGDGNRDQYSLITGRIASEDHIVSAKFAGEAGTNGLPISLYRLDTAAGTRTWVNSWTTGDWMGAQGTYFFVPEHPGSYQVKIDTAICLVDTLKFDKWLWSDTLTIAAGESVDQGWIISQDCVDSDTTISEEAGIPEAIAGSNGANQGKILSNTEWRIYPNPANRYLRLNINSDDAMNFRIYDALGRSVKIGVYQRGQTIDVHGLNAGLYHLQLRDQKDILGTKKVLLME